MLRILLFTLMMGAPAAQYALAFVPAMLTRQQYIEQWSSEAVYQMALHKIPASITLAQGILESGDGNSRLATEGNNHFGIKCHNDWTGKTIFEDDETKGECFRKYDNAQQSFEDHSAFLKRKRYESLFTLKTEDYKGWAKGLKQCGYATNAKYPELLITIIENFGLAEYDKQGAEYLKKNTLPPRDGSKELAPNNNKEKKEKDKKRSTKTDDKRSEITITNSRNVAVSDNRIRYTTVKEGETLSAIAADMDMNVWQLERYNDLTKEAKLKEGERIYLQPKRNRAVQTEHAVAAGETLWSISQKHGIKLKRLMSLNTLQDDAQLRAGQQLKLRK
ncbi:MAG: glucosaminidase domain-containing protein [Flavobacteriales bacterium]